jgi:hypothetical protein
VLRSREMENPVMRGKPAPFLRVPLKLKEVLPTMDATLCISCMCSNLVCNAQVYMNPSKVGKKNSDNEP